MRKHRAPLHQITAQVKVWNETYPVGQTVLVRLDSGETLETITRSEAEVLSDHSAVIWVEGISGCYLLDRVMPVLTSKAAGNL